MSLLNAIVLAFSSSNAFNLAASLSCSILLFCLCNAACCALILDIVPIADTPALNKNKDEEDNPIAAPIMRIVSP